MVQGITIRMKVNGQWREAETTPDRLLIDLLREEFGLTGTKKGCGEGECGACTVILNGRTALACLIPAAKAEGADILTIEGLTPEQGLHPIQQAFQDEGAVQCGYCTPGMVMTAKVLLDENPCADGGGDQAGDFGQHLPLHRLHEDRRRHRPGRRGPQGRDARPAGRGRQITAVVGQVPR